MSLLLLLSPGSPPFLPLLRPPSSGEGTGVAGTVATVGAFVAVPGAPGVVGTGSGGAETVTTVGGVVPVAGAQP